MKRVYFSYDQWEDYQFGMWRKIPFYLEDKFLEEAIKFTSDAVLYGRYMMRAINEWPNGCEHNLTCIGMNRQAYIGHSAVCIALTMPEYITRLAWHQLTEKQQDDANEQADIAIKTWEDNYAKDTNWNRCIVRFQGEDFMDIRQIREDLSLLQCGKRQHSNASLGGGGSPEKKKDIRTNVNRFGRSIQNDYGSCERLF